MTRMLVAGVISAMLVILLGPMVIRWLQRREFRQLIREDGPEGHIASKAGTPTMGGVLILLAMSVPFGVIGLRTATGFTVWSTAMLCALIGFWDDWMKISNRRSLGLSGKAKMLSLALVTLYLGYMATSVLNLDTTLAVPFDNSGAGIGFNPFYIDLPLGHTLLDLGPGYWVVLFLVLAGFSNAVNLTDGLDGLAAGTVVISLLAFLAISFLTWERDLAVVLSRRASLDVAIFAASLAGACVGFLWHNAFPARIFMGDTGSMGLGGALAALAVVTKNELLLVVIGGIFVVEALSVMLQVVSFKRTGKRIFLMAPIHHHFELRHWSETQIMVRFWIVAGLFAATGFTIWFRAV